MDADIKHDQTVAKPKGKKLARLEDIWKATRDHSKQVSEHIECIAPLYSGGTQAVEILPGVFMHVVGGDEPRKFIGMAMCTHCCRRAAMFARDLAGTLEDLADATEANKE